MEQASIQKIAIIGAGFMGSGIAQVFASTGIDVVATDSFPDQRDTFFSRLETNLNLVYRDDPEKEDEIHRVLNHVSFSPDLKQTVEGADFVIECVSENMALKQDIFESLDDLCPKEVPLSSNTSVMSITEIGARCVHKERVIGTHFWNPAYLLPLVETVKTIYTSDSIIEKTMGLLRQAGKHPILVKKDVPGFVANRLQHALWREAVSIVEHDIADAKTVDDAIKYSFGMRLPVLAPLENSDMVGTDLVYSIHEYVLPHLEASPKPSPYLKKLVEEGALGFKTGRGFMEWPEEAQEALQSKLVTYLLKSKENS